MDWAQIYAAVFIMALGLSLILTPACQKIAQIFGFLDIPKCEGHKLHAKSTPLLGGVAMYSAWILTILAALAAVTFILPEKAMQDTEVYLTSTDAGIRLSACWIFAYSCLTAGRIDHARHALQEIRNTLAANRKTAPPVRAIEAFAAFAAAVLLHLPLPDEMPPMETFLPLLPPGVRSFALYVRAHYLYLQKEYEKSVGVAEAALAMGARDYPIPAIYLHLAAVMDYMSMRQTETARNHLLAAWALARPDDLIEGFGEHHGLLGGMLEAVIKPRWPEDFRRIIDITGQFSWGWRQIHNPDTGHQVADNLTSTEFAVAMLVVRGWTTDEIAAHMKVSASTIKKHQAQIKRKLKIDTWEELEPYMLA